ncbi:DHHC palmitoyltransferase-domain-containing protein [Melampsora americana]|nr:DHHC palmitoyltransferase-domain-containing protein [Melampsora americana]
MVKRLVFKCFKSFEKLSNRLISKTGPFFIILAISLISISNFTYFEVIFYHQFLLKSNSNLIYTILNLFLSIYLSFNLLFYYFLSILVSPGSILNNKNQLHHPFKFNFLSSDRFKNSIHHQNRKIINSITNQHLNHSSSNSKSSPPPPSSSSSSSTLTTPTRRCTKCLIIHPELSIPPLKPPRAHHCRICGVCWLKYDHHCPWINQCVGLHNERYFFLFLVYMTISNIWIVYWGWTSFLISTNFNRLWNFNSPRLFMILTWILNLVIGITVGIMMIWQLILIVKGETSVESIDNGK